MMKRLHLWLHNLNLEQTRFWVAMAVAAFIVIFISLSNQAAIQENRRVTQERTKQIEQIVADLKADNEDQTQRITRQTQLLACLLAIHGQTTAISAEDAQRCRVEAEQEIKNGVSPAPRDNTAPPASGGASGGGGASGSTDDPTPNPIQEVIEAIGEVGGEVIDTLNPF